MRSFALIFMLIVSELSLFAQGEGYQIFSYTQSGHNLKVYCLDNNEKHIISAINRTDIEKYHYQVFVTHLNAKNGLVWSKRLVFENRSNISVQSCTTSDKGVIIFMNSTPPVNSTINQHIIAKLDHKGNLSWYKAFPSESYMEKKVVESQDGSLYFVLSEYDSKKFPWIIKLSSKGELIWSKRIGTGGLHYFIDDMFCGNNNEIYALGYADSAYQTHYSFLLKYDASGNILKTIKFDPSYNTHKGCVLSNNEIILVGSKNAGRKSVQAVKLDTAFSVVWSNSVYPDSVYENFFDDGSVFECKNSDLIISSLLQGKTSWEDDSYNLYFRLTTNGQLLGTNLLLLDQPDYTLYNTQIIPSEKNDFSSVSIISFKDETRPGGGIFLYPDDSMKIKGWVPGKFVYVNEKAVKPETIFINKMVDYPINFSPIKGVAETVPFTISEIKQ